MCVPVLMDVCVSSWREAPVRDYLRSACVIIAPNLQYVLIAKDKEEAYWKSQDEKYKLMLARTEMCKKTTKEVHAMLKKRAQASAAALEVIAKETVSFGTAEKGYDWDGAGHLRITDP